MKNLRESSVNPLWILLNIYCIQKNPKRIQNESNGNPNEYIMYLNESVKESIMDFPESNLDFPGKIKSLQRFNFAWKIQVGFRKIHNGFLYGFI